METTTATAEDEAEFAEIDRLVAAEQARRQRVHDAIVSKVGVLKYAGILIRAPQGGLWMGEQGTPPKLADYGGKREPGDAHAWATAVRECREESGIDLAQHRLTSMDDVVFLENRTGRTGAVFVVTTDAAPVMTGDAAVRTHRCVQGDIAQNALHDRLRFSTGVAARLRALAQ